MRVSEAHSRHDVHCIDWNAVRDELLVTGAANGSIKVWDRRRMDGALNTFLHHTEATMHVEWLQRRAAVFASGGEDG
jgi:histone-binding protein RBBP4